jgi:hypothetical protein
MYKSFRRNTVTTETTFPKMINCTRNTFEKYHNHSKRNRATVKGGEILLQISRKEHSKIITEGSKR